MAYELVAHTEVGSGGAASIEFTSIPQDGTDLVVLHTTRLDASNSDEDVELRFNSDTGNNYSYIGLLGSGSSVLGLSSSSINRIYGGRTSAATSTSNTFGNCAYYISNYTGSTISISIDSVSENNATLARQEILAASYNNGPITSLQLLDLGGSNFVAGSTASLYKVTA